MLKLQKKVASNSIWSIYDLADTNESMKAAFDVEPAYQRGSSIGAVVSMVLGKPIMFIGLSLPEHGYHAINENFDWTQASGGIRLFVDYFERLSKIR
jgi:hypothetical protein